MDGKVGETFTYGWVEMCPEYKVYETSSYINCITPSDMTIQIYIFLSLMAVGTHEYKYVGVMVEPCMFSLQLHECNAPTPSFFLNFCRDDDCVSLM